MSEQGITSKRIDWEILAGQGRVSRVTLGLLLSTRLQASVREAHTSGLARLMRATDGLILSALAYEQAESMSVAHYEQTATFRMWLTQFATIQGFLVASGEHPPSWVSTRLKVREILSTSAARDLLDVVEYTTKRERARALTRWALGVGRFSQDMSLETMWERLWRAETTLRNGFHLTSELGLPSAVLEHPGRTEKPLRGR